MTRNSHSRHPSSSTRSSRTDVTSNGDSFANLPDLSGLREDEKRHILNVLLRDENLRNKHLARFRNLRKEVADLEQKPEPTSKSVCARCQTPFGFLFNTGDLCSGCGAKVCKQCRLMYNVNDNGWLCQLCCKQMQLMSYSGEWIYLLRSNLRTGTSTASQLIRQSLTPSISMQNLDDISSSDTETESTVNSSERKAPVIVQTRFLQTATPANQQRMVVQSSGDEHKLNSLKQTSQQRSLHPRSREVSTTNSNLYPIGSSDEVNAFFDEPPTPTVRNSAASNRASIQDINQRRSSSTKRPEPSPAGADERDVDTNSIRRSRLSVDCASVTSSEWGGESERGDAKLAKKRESKSTLATRLHLPGSMHSLRDAVHTKRRITGSQASLNASDLSRRDVSDTASAVSQGRQQNTQPFATSDDASSITNGTYRASNNTLTTVTTLPDKRRASESQSQQSKPNAFGSVGHIDAADSDDDIDKTFEEAKLVIQNRAASCMDMRGSQLSLNSAFSDTKARYGLDITGTIDVKLTYNLTTGALDVFINQCKNLARAKKNQTSDPYIKVYLLPDRSKNSKRKSSVVKNTTDPVFAERFRYHITKQEFEVRVLWISVWSQAALGHNDFLGEIHIPLANCVLDVAQEHPLLAQKKKNELTPEIQPTMDPAEIIFQITFMENPVNKEVGTLQIHRVQAKSIFYGKHQVELICKGVLMPDKVKRKMPTVQKGPTPKWEVPLRWDGVRRNNLKNSSLEISIWCQERFRKFMFGFVRLNMALRHFDNKPVTWSDATQAEKAAWNKFITEPTRVHHFQLPLRPATGDNK